MSINVAIILCKHSMTKYLLTMTPSYKAPCTVLGIQYTKVS